MSAEVDHYHLLGVPPDATASAIRAAYRRLAREIHPDHSAAADATSRMARLNEAHAVLSDPLRRRDYDRKRAESRRPAAAGFRPGAFARARAGGAVREQPSRRTRAWVKPEMAGIPDWYAFLAIEPLADPAAVLAALQARRAAVLADQEMGFEEREWNLAGLREARDILGSPRERSLYDRLRRDFVDTDGRQRHAYDNWYAFLGVRPSAPAGRIAEKVTDLAPQFATGSRGARYLQAAWAALRDREIRAAYDATIGSAVPPAAGP